MAVQLPANIRVGIIDRTSVEGLLPETLRMLEGASLGAKAAGLSHLILTAGKGAGHKSHDDGSEVDLDGRNPDGSEWTQDQRVTVSIHAARAGATRFGLYSRPDGSFIGNALHLGTGGGPHVDPRNVTWGFKGLTSGEASRAFTHPAEKAFALAVKEGRAAQMTPPIGVSPSLIPSVPTQPPPVPTTPKPTPPNTLANHIAAFFRWLGRLLGITPKGT